MILIAVTTRFAVPVFVITTVFVLVLPTVALPKDNELGEMVAETVGPDPDPGSETPVLPHPVMSGKTSNRAKTPACAILHAIEFLGFDTVPLVLPNFCG